MKTFDLIFLIVKRILCFPAIAVIVLVNHVVQILRHLTWYWPYGGETKIYAPEERASMTEVYYSLKSAIRELQEQQNIKAKEEMASLSDVDKNKD